MAAVLGLNTTTATDLVKTEGIANAILQANELKRIFEIVGWIIDASGSGAGTLRIPGWDSIDVPSGVKTVTDEAAYTDFTTSKADVTAGVVIVRSLLSDELAQDGNVAEAEAAIRGWHLDLAARGLDVDVSAADWTRHFRLPHVRRDGRPYRSPLVDIDRMRPIAIAGVRAGRARVGRGGPLPEVTFGSELPERYHALVVDLALVVSRYATTRHNLFMCLVGALLGARRLLPEHAVAFAEALAWRTGAVVADARRRSSASSASSSAAKS